MFLNRIKIGWNIQHPFKNGEYKSHLVLWVITGIIIIPSTVYPLVIKHGMLENPPIHKWFFLAIDLKFRAGMSQRAMLDDTTSGTYSNYVPIISQLCPQKNQMYLVSWVIRTCSQETR